MNSSKFSHNALVVSLSRAFHTISKHAVLLFLLFLVAVYGYTLYRINTLVSAEPDTTLTAAEQSKTPRIDPAVVKRLEQLKDNSVNVQTLFDQARNNPFNE